MTSSHVEDSQGESHKKDFTIYINTEPKTVDVKELSFEQLVDLAYPGQPQTETRVYTVTYRRANGNKQGSLVAGEVVHAKEGMIVDVTPTDRS